MSPSLRVKAWGALSGQSPPMVKEKGSVPATQRVGRRETRGSLATAPSLAGICPPENLESPLPVAPAALPGGLASCHSCVQTSEMEGH